MTIRQEAVLLDDADELFIRPNEVILEIILDMSGKNIRQNTGSLFSNGYTKFSQTMLDITSYEYMERGLIFSIREIDEKWKELTFIERLKYNLIR